MRAVVVICAGLLLMACGGSDQPELEPAVRAYSDAYLSGNADEAHARMTSRCQERTDLDELRGIAAAAKEQYGEAEMTSFEVVEQSGNLARVTYEYDQSAINQTQEPWALEDGEWRNDDC
jgi:major membrane immunogen (membrane-anchored lipoprotein)